MAVTGLVTALFVLLAPPNAGAKHDHGRRAAPETPAATASEVPAPASPAPQAQAQSFGKGGGRGHGAGRGRGAGQAKKQLESLRPSREVPAVVAAAPTPAATPTPAPAPVSAPAPASPPAELPAPASPPDAGKSPASDSPGAPVSERLPTRSGPAAPVAAPAGSAFGPPQSAPGAGAPAADEPPARPARRPRTRPRPPRRITRTVVRTVRRAVEVVPPVIWALVGALAALSLLGTAGSSLLARRAKRLARQREALLEDVGLLQRALLPDAPEQIEGVSASAAYRPATSGPPGGDFYDVFALDAERLGVLVGRVSVSGKRALGVSALVRHVLRA